MATRSPAKKKRDKEIVRLRLNQGLSTHVLAARFGITHQWVSVILRAAGVGEAVKLNWKRDEEIARLRQEEGLTHSQIAEQLGLTPGLVSGVLLRAGIKTVRPSLAERNAEIVKLRKRRKTVRSIAEHFGLRPATVMEVLRKAGMTNAGYAVDRKALDKRNAEIARMRGDGHTIGQIANKVGLAPNSVSRILSEAGIVQSQIRQGK